MKQYILPGNFFLEEIQEKNRSMSSLEQTLNLYYLLREVLKEGIKGEVVEVGCYRGLTSLVLQKTLIQLRSDKKLHIYDSFEGLGEKSERDLLDSKVKVKRDIFIDNRRVKERWFQCSREEVRQTFASFETPLPQIHEGWLEDTLSDSLPDTIAFAHLDVDFYLSTLKALEEIYPRLSEGAILILDDYCDPKIHGRVNNLPGVKEACDEFFLDKPEKIELLSGGRKFHACLTKAGGGNSIR